MARFPHARLCLLVAASGAFACATRPTDAGSSPATSTAGWLSGLSPAGIVSSTSGVHVVSQSGPSGEWFRTAGILNDNNAPADLTDPGPYTGPYTPPSGGGLGSPLDSGLITYPGGGWNTSARAVMAYSQGTWNTRQSLAHVDAVSPAPTGIVDSTATLSDPADYTAEFDLAFPPEARFRTTLEAGLGLNAFTSAPGLNATAQISGIFTTNLLIDEQLWSFNWTADSDNPGLSTFTFQSDPSLGLDDAAITAAFMANLIDNNGSHILAQDFIIEAVVPVFVSDDPTVSYSFGGDIQYNAHAMPEPATIGLLLAGLAFLRRRTA